MRDLFAHDLVVQRGILDVCQNGDAPFAAMFSKLLNIGKVSFFILPPHAFVAAAVEQIQSQIRHPVSALSGVIPVMPFIEPEGISLYACCGLFSDPPVHRQIFMVAESPYKTAGMIYDIHKKFSFISIVENIHLFTSKVKYFPCNFDRKLAILAVEMYIVQNNVF
jgi:hypothetical protein